MKTYEMSLGWAVKQPNPAAALQQVFNNWQQYEQEALRHAARRARAMAEEARLRTERSELCRILGIPLLFSPFAAYGLAAVTALIACCGVAEWLEGGAL